MKPFIPDDLTDSLMSPVRYRVRTGSGRQNYAGRGAYGYEATLLPLICEVVLDAEKAGALGQKHRLVVTAAELLIRGFARVGVIALIDEATGYQAERARDELRKILEAYIARELLPWTERFPNEFFKQIYRLHGWEFRAGTIQGPRYVGKLINRLVYEPLPPGVLEELKRINPPNERGYRRYRHHQFLTADIGNPHLQRQIIEVTALMRVSDDKQAFFLLFDKAFPRRGQQIRLALSSGEDPESSETASTACERLS